MKNKMVWIDAHGTLYRGFGREYPAIVWRPVERQWAVSDIPTPCDWDWGELVTESEAERCFPGSTSARVPDGIEVEAEIDFIKYRPELFDGNDGPTYRKSPAETKMDRVRREQIAPLQLVIQRSSARERLFGTPLRNGQGDASDR